MRQIPITFKDQRAQDRSLLKRIWSLVAESDTTPTKFLLAMTATFWSTLLLLPGDSLSRPVYQYLALIAGDYPDEKWSVAWGIYAVLMWWRIFTVPGKARWFPMLLNCYGMVLFFTIPICIFLQRLYPFPIGAAPYVALAFASGWVAVRTNINTVRGWRGD